MKTSRATVWVALCAGVWLACDPPPEEAKAPVEPASPVAVSVPADGQVFRFVDPTDGAVKTARLAVDAGIFPLFEVEDGIRYNLNVSGKNQP
ncbi:MAG: hypothetical protein QF464_10170, partial [Myxococcota bacterium]|nr:hypothetical protein [Myxococcota bacterium]